MAALIPALLPLILPVILPVVGVGVAAVVVVVAAVAVKDLVFVSGSAVDPVVDLVTSSINFPIPFLTDYYRYRLGDPRQIRTISDILENTLLNSKNEIRTPIEITCPHCRGEFKYWTYTQSMCCPICRRPLELGGLEEGYPYVTPHKRLPRFIELLSASMTYKGNKYPLDTNY
jgi:hypothetical protein